MQVLDKMHVLWLESCAQYARAEESELTYQSDKMLVFC